MRLPPEEWPEVPQLIERPLPVEEKDSPPKVVLLSAQAELPILNRVSSYTKLNRVTAWIFHFVHNSRIEDKGLQISIPLTTKELIHAERYWLLSVQ